MQKLDILNRQEFVNKLVNLTENISATRISTSFAINGVWGCGKSFVLDMYEERLTKIQCEETASDKYFVIRYNCWKYDYYEEPLVAIVAAMIDIINKKTKLWYDEEMKARILGVLKAVGTTLLSMVNNGIKDKTGIDIQSAYKTTKIKINEEEAKIEKSHEYDVNFSFNQALHRLQDLIAELSQFQTVVFMVDELDRCLPEYSIKVLERLHHLAENSNNVVTVLSIDGSQLQASIQQIFGFKNPERYLEKFIQFEILLDKGIVSERIIDKYSSYIELFDKNLIQYDDSIEEFMKEVFKNIEVREQENLIHRATLAHKILFNTKKDYSFMCLEILILVLNTCYNDIKKFTKWFDKVYSLTEASKREPYFAGYFNEKFDEIPYIEKINSSPYVSEKYCLEFSQLTLYSAIAYSWYWLFLSQKYSKKTININNKECDPVLKTNIEDLKKFRETIQFIN